MKNLTENIDHLLDTFSLSCCIIVNVENWKKRNYRNYSIDDFEGLIKSTFWSNETIANLHNYLDESILPQMMRQGDTFCILGMLNARRTILYGLFGVSEMEAAERYEIAEQADKQINSFSNLVLKEFI